MYTTIVSHYPTYRDTRVLLPPGDICVYVSKGDYLLTNKNQHSEIYYSPKQFCYTGVSEKPMTHPAPK